jgi:dolichol-phosphate mannosyltransferase
MDISVIIPIYNEENNIQIVLEELISTLDKNNISNEIILINDGSTDNTINKINQFFNQKNIKIISHQTNKGISNALKTGFDHTNNDTIVTMGADGQTDPKYIPFF